MKNDKQANLHPKWGKYGGLQQLHKSVKLG